MAYLMLGTSLSVMAAFTPWAVNAQQLILSAGMMQGQEGTTQTYNLTKQNGKYLADVKAAILAWLNHVLNGDFEKKYGDKANYPDNVNVKVATTKLPNGKESLKVVSVTTDKPAPAVQPMRSAGAPAVQTMRPGAQPTQISKSATPTSFINSNASNATAADRAEKTTEARRAAAEKAADARQAAADAADDARQAAAERAANKNIKPNTNMLADKIDGKLLLKADLGYVYNFASAVTAPNGVTASKSNGSSGFGYGLSLGYTSRLGWGLAADYLGLNHSWQSTIGNNPYNFSSPYHVITLTPSYRLTLDKAKNWGLRFGLGVGVSVSDLSWKAAGVSGGISASNGAAASNGGNATSNGGNAPVRVANGAAFNWTSPAGTGASAVALKDTNAKTTINCFGQEVYDSLGDSAGAHASQCKDNIFATPVTYNNLSTLKGGWASLDGSLANQLEQMQANGWSPTYKSGSGKIAQALWVWLLNDANNDIYLGHGKTNTVILVEDLIRQAGDQFQTLTSNNVMFQSMWASMLGNTKDIQQLSKFINAAGSKLTLYGGSTTIVPYSVYSQLSAADQVFLKNLQAKVGSANLAFGQATPTDWLNWSSANVSSDPAGGNALVPLTQATLNASLSQSAATSLTFLTQLLNVLKFNGTGIAVSGAPATIPYNVYTLLSAAQQTDLANAINGTATTNTLNGKLAGAVTLGAVPTNQWTNPAFVSAPVTVGGIAASYQHVANLNPYVGTVDSLISLLGQLVAINHGADIIDNATVIPYNTYTATVGSGANPNANALASQNATIKSKLTSLLTGGKLSYGVVPASQWLNGNIITSAVSAPVNGATVGYEKASANAWVSQIVSGTSVDATKFTNFLNQLAIATSSTPTISAIRSVLTDPRTAGGNVIEIPYSIHSAIAANSTQAAVLDALVASGLAVKVAKGANANAVLLPQSDSPTSETNNNNRVGAILAPQMAVEYDNGLIHADVSLKYIHQLNNVTYADGVTTKAGPVAIFLGAGFGVNF